MTYWAPKSIIAFCKGVNAMAKMGRPPLENPRKKRLNLRFTEEEYNRLKAYASKCNVTMTEVILEKLSDVISEK